MRASCIDGLEDTSVTMSDLPAEFVFGDYLFRRGVVLHFMRTFINMEFRNRAQSVLDLHVGFLSAPGLPPFDVRPPRATIIHPSRYLAAWLT